MFDIQWFENAGTIIGVILMVFSAFTGLIVWFDKRLKKAADGAISEASGHSKVLERKVLDIEGDVRRLAGSVEGVQRNVHSLDGRVHEVERSLETVARHKDVSALNAELKQLGGSMTTQLTMLTGMMHSFRESALRSAEKGSGK